MGKASTAKKVARAAGTGGGRTNRGRIPWLYYLAIFIVVMLGTLTIVQSRDSRLNKLSLAGLTTPPVPNKDHWHVAYAVYLCDKFAPPITDQNDPKGIHTHGDGIIHVHPTARDSAGANATLGVFASAVHMTLNAGELKLPGGHDYRDGDKCGSKSGRVRVRVFTSQADTVGKDSTLDPRKVPMVNGELLTIAFAPVDAKLPPPPSAANLQKLNDVAPTTTTTVPGATSTTAPSSTTTPSTTTAPATTTTPPTTTKK
jgi:hypothetical protein